MAENGRQKGNGPLLAALAAGATVRQAAEQAGVSERTAYRRLADPNTRTSFISVFNWRMGERRDAGDLRLYGFVQFYPLVTIPLMMYLFPARYTRSGDVFVALGWYVLAKVLEVSHVDHGIYSAGHLVSGHTLKHLSAALGAYWLYRMVRDRRPIRTATCPCL